MHQNDKIIGIGIKTFQKLANDQGHYGSIMYRSASVGSAVSDDFHQARQRRIKPHVAGHSPGDFGTQTINVVAGAALFNDLDVARFVNCLLYTSPSPRDRTRSRMPSSA